MMLENLLWMATGSGLTLVGGLVGYFVRPRRVPESRPGPQQCGCTHPLAMHDPKTDECHGQVLRRNMRSKRGDWIGDQWMPCPCRQYTGEKPLDLSVLNQPLPELSAETRRRLENEGDHRS